MIRWHGKLALGLACGLLICVGCTLGWAALQWSFDMIDNVDECFRAVVAVMLLCLLVCEGLRRRAIGLR